MGAVNMLLGIVVAVVLITTIHAPPESSRAWRLFAVPLAGIGFMQAYSAWRGFVTTLYHGGVVVAQSAYRTHILFDAQVL